MRTFSEPPGGCLPGSIDLVLGYWSVSWWFWHVKADGKPSGWQWNRKEMLKESPLCSDIYSWFSGRFLETHIRVPSLDAGWSPSWVFTEKKTSTWLAFRRFIEKLWVRMESLPRRPSANRLGANHQSVLRRKKSWHLRNYYHILQVEV